MTADDILPMTADCRVCLSVHSKLNLSLFIRAWSLFDHCCTQLNTTVHTCALYCTQLYTLLYTYVNYVVHSYTFCTVVHSYTFCTVVHNYTFLTVLHSRTLFWCTNCPFCTIVHNCTLLSYKMHIIGFLNSD